MDFSETEACELLKTNHRLFFYQTVTV